jgi:transposase InsO family protein
VVTPAARRQAVAHACTVHDVSERRACEALSVDRSSVRYRSRRACDAAARLCIRGLAAQRRRFGYRRLHLLLTRAGHHMNHKRFRRLYREEKLQVRRLAAKTMVARYSPGARRITLGGDKGYDARKFIGDLRALNIARFWPRFLRSAGGRRLISRTSGPYPRFP